MTLNTTSCSSLTWIHSSDGLGPKSPGIRTVIRKQAMSRAAAARRRRGTYGKQNLGQHLVLRPAPNPPEQNAVTQHPEHDTEDHEGTVGDRSSPMEVSVDTLGTLQQSGALMFPIPANSSLGWIPACLSSTGYEAMRMRFDYDIIDASALTAVHIGRATAQPLQEKPARLSDILQSKRWSYFQYLPSRYGQTQCLDDALCCLAARIRQWITHPGKPSRTILQLYSKAVKSLQAALDDVEMVLHSDVLCATEILTLYELLDSERDRAWMPHTKGTATLIRLRGPKCFPSDYDKALFFAQLGPIFSEAMTTSSQCFLKEPEWQAILESLILERSIFLPSDQALIRLWACIIPIPGLFHKAQKAVCNREETSFLHRHNLLQSLLEIRLRLMAWGTSQRFTLTKKCGLMKYSYMRLEQARTELDYEMFGILATNLMQLERVIVGLDHTLAAEMEPHAQRLAGQLIDLQRAASLANPRAALFLTFKVKIAKAALATADEWQQNISNPDSPGVVSKGAFQHWLALSIEAGS
ncbi:MAG: hypothetical protein Q9220_005043 [cf. Caloplaca sp. 1 TL-2023]